MSTTLTGAVAVNAAFLQEIKDDNQGLRDLLARADDHFCRPAPGRVSLRRAREILEQLRDQLAMHFALEEAYGYFDDAVSTAPHLSRQAEDLRAEHTGLFEEICRLADRAERCAHRHLAGVPLARLARDYRDFRARLAEHEAEETRLVLSAFEEDLGTGD